MSSLHKSVRKALGFSTLLGGALLLGGCGGGGSGPSVPATPVPTTAPGTLLADEFNSGSLDGKRWTVLGSTLNIQRTQMGNTPSFAQDSDGTRYMRVKLDSYLPTPSVRDGNSLEFLGTEVGGTMRFARGNGVSFESRMRLSAPNQAGMVAAMFLYSEKGIYGGTPPLLLDEIDHELLTTPLNSGSPYTWTNIYNDFILHQPGQGDGDSYVNNPTKTEGLPEPIIATFNPSGWNTYRIEWKAGSVQWFINDTLIRTDTSARVPDDALGVRFNIWAASAPPTGWAAAFSDTLKAATSAADNKTYSLDVDWIHVKSLDGSAATTSPLVFSAPRTSGAPMAGYKGK